MAEVSASSELSDILDNLALSYQQVARRHLQALCAVPEMSDWLCAFLRNLLLADGKKRTNYEAIYGIIRGIELSEMTPDQVGDGLNRELIRFGEYLKILEKSVDLGLEKVPEIAVWSLQMEDLRSKIVAEWLGEVKKIARPPFSGGNRLPSGAR
jgi:hypothetical protein